ncbi:MAG: type II secretion system F family protein [Verrucomicrobia subdivision 3 bacterium]|nr:type II secretion system F family protein [Limisphaerales bacterium]
MTDNDFIQIIVIVGLVLLMFPMLRLGGFVLGLPLRRRENSRLFLNLLEMGLREGRRAEEIFLSCARAGDRSVEFLTTPRTPFVLGMVHILMGAVSLIITLICMVTYPSNQPVDDYGFMPLFGLVIIWDGFIIWAGVQLIRFRAWGRRLAIWLALVNILLASASSASLFFGGQFAGGCLAFAGFIIPAMFIFLLTKPEVVAVCGRKGKQEPLLVTRLREMELVVALRQAPGLIEPRIVSLLAVGRELGDLQKVLPACRAVLGEATGKARTAQNHFVLLLLVVMPMSLIILPILGVFIFPKFQAIISEMSAPETSAVLFDWLMVNLGWVVGIHALVLLAIWVFALAFLAGPRLEQYVARVVPGLSARMALALPWRRKRVQRDFSVSLALLLDAGLPEARALELAAESTGNRIYQNRAVQVSADLANGMPLPEAVGRIDGSGEFQWRLTTAARAGQGFLPALRAWHEMLDARASQQEQSAAQMATTGLVFYNGAVVGLVMLSVFQFLISAMEAVSLW